jgi:hypothetical protein
MEMGRPDTMDIDVRKAYKEWARGASGAYNSEDAYCAGYELAMRVRDEQGRREDNPIIKKLKAVVDVPLPFG